MVRIALVVTYLIATVIAVDALDDGGGEVSAVWAVASLVLGAGTGQFRFAILALLAVPIAIPFGFPADMSGDPVFPVWVAAMIHALFSGGLILVAVLGRQAVESHLRRRRTPRDSGAT